MIRPACGTAPSLSVKLWSRVSVPEGSSLNTVPKLEEPPNLVVPKRLPEESTVKPLSGFLPSLGDPAKLCSTLRVCDCADRPPNASNKSKSTDAATGRRRPPDASRCRLGLPSRTLCMIPPTLCLLSENPRRQGQRGRTADEPLPAA